MCSLHVCIIATVWRVVVASRHCYTAVVCFTAVQLLINADAARGVCALESSSWYIVFSVGDCGLSCYMTDLRFITYAAGSAVVLSIVWSKNSPGMHRLPSIYGTLTPQKHSVYPWGWMYLKDRFNYEYLILWFGYHSHYAGTNNCGIEKSTTPTNYSVYTS